MAELTKQEKQIVISILERHIEQVQNQEEHGVNLPAEIVAEKAYEEKLQQIVGKLYKTL